MDYEDHGDKLEDGPVLFTKKVLEGIPNGEVIKDICIYKPEDSLYGFFDDT